jgi:phosphohistidine phosphatase SixA
VGYVDQRLEPSIYDATPGTLIELADGHKDVERLLLVGHNPGFEQLAALMHSGQSGDYRGMPPGGIAVLSVPKERRDRAGRRAPGRLLVAVTG